MYSVFDALNARWQYLAGKGVPDVAIRALSSSNVIDHDSMRFTYEPDVPGQAEFEVTFIDDNGNAEIRFADGEEGTVKIGVDRES
jgi:hypothetical protein